MTWVTKIPKPFRTRIEATAFEIARRAGRPVDSVVGAELLFKWLLKEEEAWRREVMRHGLRDAFEALMRHVNHELYRIDLEDRQTGEVVSSMPRTVTARATADDGEEAHRWSQRRLLNDMPVGEWPTWHRRRRAAIHRERLEEQVLDQIDAAVVEWGDRCPTVGACCEKGGIDLSRVRVAV